MSAPRTPPCEKCRRPGAWALLLGSAAAHELFACDEHLVGMLDPKRLTVVRATSEAAPK